MTDDLRGLEQIIEPMRGPVGEYGALIRRLFTDNLKSLTLFGAVVTDRFDATHQTVRSVVELDHIDLDQLRNLAGHGPGLGKSRISAPLIMTKPYIAASIDTFPLELIEIQQKHTTLFGDDPFAGLDFDSTHVRLQCERDLKAQLITLRQGLLSAAGNDRALAGVQSDVGVGVLRALRGLLWLDGQKEGLPAGEVVSKAATLVKHDLKGVRAAIQPAAAGDWDAFQSLYRDLEALAEYANAL